MTGILEQLKWESLKKRRTDNRLILLYQVLKGKARTPTDDLIPKTRRCRNSPSKAFQLSSASIEACKCSFFPETIRDWNDLPDSLFSRWLCVQVRFTRANKGLISPQSERPGEILSFGVSPVSYSDSDWLWLNLKRLGTCIFFIYAKNHLLVRSSTWETNF